MLLPFLLCLLILYLPPLAGGEATAWPTALVGVAALALLNAAVGWGASSLAIRLWALPSPTGPRGAHRVFAFLKGLVVGLVLADVLVLRWPEVVEGLVGRWRWGVLAYDPLLVLPALLMALTAMAFQHRFDSTRRAVALPLGRYVWLRFRFELALVLAPWLALVVVGGATDLAFARSPWRDVADLITSGAVLTALIVFGPWMLRVLWATSRLPGGPLRERLEGLCRRAGFRCHDILVWHTHRHLANAAVVGPTPLLRYVLMTDALLEHCTDDEVEAIFAHEVGHVRRWHLPLYVLFGLGFACLYANVVDLLAGLGLVQPLTSIVALDVTADQTTAMLLFALAYWGLVFGYVSRRMEQEADLFAARSVADPWAFVAALDKLAALGDVARTSSSWRHFSIARRQRFLADALGDPAVQVRFRRRIVALKWFLALLIVGGAVRLLLARPELFTL